MKAKHIKELVAVATGLIAVSAGIALMYVLPQYIIGILNQTGLFAAAQITTANTNVATIQALGLLVTIIGLLWIVIGVISRPESA